MEDSFTLIHLSETIPFLPICCPNPLCESLHVHLVTVARFREGDEATSVVDRRDPFLDIIGGVELHKGGGAPTMGGFLVKFLRKETWNVGTSGTLSKEGNVYIQFLN